MVAPRQSGAESLSAALGPMAKLVYAADLKSVARKGFPVQVRVGPPAFSYLHGLSW